MNSGHDDIFHQSRSETYDRVIAQVNARLQSATPVLTLRTDDLSADALKQGTEKEVWSLFLGGIRHLKNGAPGNQPGSVTEPLSRMSLRSSAFAASLGVKPPQFEKMFFSANFSNGNEAALFFCRRLLGAAEGDLSKSKQIIQQKILVEKTEETLKKQMAFSFGMLVDAYVRCCKEFKGTLGTLVLPKKPMPGFEP